MTRRLGRFLAVSMLLTGCAGRPAPPATQRLVDLLGQEGTEVSGSAIVVPPPRAAWRFDDRETAPLADWISGGGVTDLEVRDGRLQGETTAESAIVYVEWHDELEVRDRLHAVDIELRVSHGTTLEVEFRGRADVNLDTVHADEFWALSTPLLPGDEVHTYRLRSTENRLSPGIRRVFLRPSDAVGARFEIRSVRLVFDREHLRETPSGVSWRGLDDIFHESIVTKAPETIRIPLTLGHRPWLDLSIGIMDEVPATFRVEAQSRGSNDAPVVLMERTVTTSDQWERTPVDLAPLAGHPFAGAGRDRPGCSRTLGVAGRPEPRPARGRNPRDTARRYPDHGGHDPSGSPRRLWIRPGHDTGARPDRGERRAI